MMFEPTWASLCKKLATSRKGQLMTAEVELSQIPVLPKPLQGVSGFPTIMMVENGKVTKEYNGMRTEDSVMEFVDMYMLGRPKPKASPKPKAKPKSKPKSA
jgi:thioredoxin-like negative regulator of GroEL